jgi:Type I restriction modification DNA specificity domain
MSELPPGWAWATVGEIAKLTDGPFGSNLKTSHYVEHGPRVVRLQNIGEGVFRDEHAHIQAEHFERLRKHEVTPGDVVAASLGENPPRACLVPPWLGLAIVKADCIRIRTADGVEPGYLMWMLNSRPIRDQAAARVRGVGRPRLGLGGIRQLTVPVPPLNEQRRILAAIEKNFSRVDVADATLKQSEFRAVQLGRVASSEPFQGDWPTRSLAEVNDPERPIRYGILMPKEDVADGVLYVRVRDYPRGVIELDGLRRTSPEIALKYKRSTLRPGDVLLAIRGTYGRVAITPPELDGGNITQDTARIAPLPELENRYLAAFLRSENAQRYFRRVARGVAVKGVNIGDLRTMPVPVPPLEEQRRIVAEVEAKLSAMDALRAAIERAQRRSAALRRAVLERAFRGELVPQDPSDEPAETLLARIRASLDS